jgi:hypothetical protein
MEFNMTIVSFGLVLVQDLDSNPDPNPKLTTGRIRIRTKQFRIRDTAAYKTLPLELLDSSRFIL